MWNMIDYSMLARCKTELCKGKINFYTCDEIETRNVKVMERCDHCGYTRISIFEKPNTVYQRIIDQYEYMEGK